MDSWSHNSEGKGFFFNDELDLLMDTRSKKCSMGWDMKSPCNYENNVLVPDREVLENEAEPMHLGYSGAMGKPFLNNPSFGISNFNLFSREEESRSRISNSAIESSSQESSLIDLKLGNLGDYMPCTNKISKGVSSSIFSPAKKARTTSSIPHNPICQVHGCKMDLSSSKDYHKRHKVCDAHSKTSKVIVNGIEQRFCQQCSRFHLLAEFDDGKRSCRKRLAGHNERRRKPQLNNHSSKVQKLLQPYQGSQVPMNSLPKKMPFLFPSTLSGPTFFPEYHQGSIKLEEEPIVSAQNEPFLHLHGDHRHHPFEIISSGNEDFSFENATAAHELSGISNSTCAAPSLLSDNNTQSFEIVSMAGDYTNRNPEKIFEESCGEGYVPNRFYSSGVDLLEVQPEFEPEFMSDPKYPRGSECAATIDLIRLSSHLQRIHRERSSMQVKQENDVFCAYPIPSISSSVGRKGHQH